MNTKGVRKSSHAFRLYGLGVRSEWPFSAVPMADIGTVDIDIVAGPASLFQDAAHEAAVPPEDSSLFRYARLRDGSTYLRYFGLWEFVIAPGANRVAGRSLGPTSQEAFETYLLGQVLSFCLLERGLEPIHATVVVVDGGAVGFLGDSGYGKSSLAATFVRAGYPLLTDDLLVVSEGGDAVLAQPGPARLKLYPHSAERLLGEGATGIPVNPLTRKLLVPIAPGLSCRSAVPLKAIYVLPPPSASAGVEEISMRQLSPREAFIELIKNTYNPVITESQRLQVQFGLAARLSVRVPFKGLSYPRDLELLPSICEAILEDLHPGPTKIAVG